MSKIQKWHEARKTHEELVECVRAWSDKNSSAICPLNVSPLSKCLGIREVAVEWVMARKSELYRDLVAFSRQRVLAAAREALAECEQIRADAAMDVESIEEGE